MQNFPLRPQLLLLHVSNPVVPSLPISQARCVALLYLLLSLQVPIPHSQYFILHVSSPCILILAIISTSQFSGVTLSRFALRLTTTNLIGYVLQWGVGRNIRMTDSAILVFSKILKGGRAKANQV